MIVRCFRLSSWRFFALRALCMPALWLGTTACRSAADGVASAAISGRSGAAAATATQAGTSAAVSGEAGRAAQASQDAAAAPRTGDGGPTGSANDDDAGMSSDAGRVHPEPSEPSDHVELPQLQPPEIVGPLVGPGATTVQPAGVQLWGTDLGYTFLHKDTLFMLFGDSMPSAKYYCETHDPFQDDALGTLPLSAPNTGVPALHALTVPDHADQFSTMQVTIGGTPVEMGLSRTAATAWSDGTRAVAMIGHIDLTTCAPGSSGASGCDDSAGFSCVRDIGTCQPAIGDTVRPCGSAANGGGCMLGQTCTVPKEGYCVDLSSSQYDGTPATVPFAITRSSPLAVQRDDDPSVYDTQYTFVSKKFHNSVARTVARIAPQRRDDDYAPGHGTLLLFGRPGFFGERGGQAQLYLLKHMLPLAQRDGALVFEPQYFAGVDALSGEARWSRLQRDAVALAMDGKRNGDPSEPLLIPNVSAIEWLGAPINKWIMLYAGDMPDVLLLDTDAQPETRGPIRVRFADRPWGPWSPPRDYFSPGKPDVVGDPYGPGGFLFHTDCRDQSDHACAKTDPVRPTDSFLPGCPTITPQTDVGRLYGVNIIQPYTRASGAGLDIYWNLSTWNPYGVTLLRSHIDP